MKACEVDIIFKSGARATFLVEEASFDRQHNTFSWTYLKSDRHQRLAHLKLYDVSAMFFQDIEVPE